MTITMIYASTSGNVEIVMETISDLLKAQGLETVLSRAEQTPIDTIVKNDTFILGTSTWEHGRMNPFFDTLYGELQKTDCHGKRAAFLGLGDYRYEPVLYCEGMEQLHARWLEQGGTEIGTWLKINGEPYGQLNTLVPIWTKHIVEDLNNHAK